MKHKEKTVTAEDAGKEETYLNDADESDPVWAELAEEEADEGFDHSWLEQFVLELNVDPLTDAIGARNLTEKKQKLTG